MTGVTATIEAFGRDEPAPLPDKPLWAKCVKCSHCWPVAYLPMDMATFGKITKRGFVCPKCGDRKPVLAKQTNGVLEEPGAADPTQTAASTHPSPDAG